MKLIAPVLILAAGLLLSVKTSPAKPDYTRRTGKDCEFCHPPDSRKLNQAGEYYRDHRNSLKGYQPPPEPSKEKTAGKTHAFDSQVEISSKNRRLPPPLTELTRRAQRWPGAESAKCLVERENESRREA